MDSVRSRKDLTSVAVHRRKTVKLHPEDRIALRSLILHLKTLFSFSLSCEVNSSNGRISRLSDAVLDGDVIVQWNTPFNCDRDLAYVRFRDLLMDDRPTDRRIGFPCLHLLSLADPQTSESIVSWMADKKLPALKKLNLSNIRNNQFEATRALLFGIDPRITKMLTEIRYHLYSGEMEENDLYTLFVEVLPRFPNLERLYLFYVHIAALQQMLNRMIELDPLIAAPSTPLSFESTAAKRIEIHDMKSFRKIEYLWSCCRADVDNTVQSFSPRKGRDDDDNDGRFSERTSSKNEPRSCVSAWPLVLKRALLLETYDGTVKFDKDDMIAGLYHTLREGPVLLSRCVAGGNPHK